MENASKALVMAGGILIAIMILATLAYAAGQWGLIPQSMEQSKEAQQLAKFNQEYESYNKDVMYGSDVVSVLNKAISNNSVIGNDTTHPNYIDIKIKINQGAIGETVTDYKTTYYKDGTTKTSSNPKQGTIILRDGQDYSLKVNLTVINDLLKGTAKTKRTDPKPGKENGNQIETYTVTIPALQEFKGKRYFSCTGVRYNNQGRVNYLEFTEITINDDEG